MADSASPHAGFTGSLPDAGQGNIPTTGENAPAPPCGAAIVVWCGSSIARLGVVPWTILRDVTGENRQRRGRHASAQLAAASHGVFAATPCPLRRGAGQADPAQPVRLLEGAPSIARRGWALRRSPGRQAKRAAPQARRR